VRLHKGEKRRKTEKKKKMMGREGWRNVHMEIP